MGLTIEEDIGQMARVSISATSWEEYWGKLDSTPMPTTPQRARARVPGTLELSSANARQPHGQYRSVDIASTRIPLYKRPESPTTSGFLATPPHKICDPHLRRNPRSNPAEFETWHAKSSNRLV